MNVLDDHDGVVHQDADGEDQGEERHAVQRESPRPRGKQRRGQRQNHCAADNGGFASTERQEHQCDDRRGGEQQLLDELLRLVVGGGAVVARFRDLDVVRYDGIAQHLHATHHGVGYVNGVLARFLGDGDGHGRILAAVLAGHALPDIATRRKGTITDGGHVLQENRLAVADADHQFRDIVGILEEGAGFDGDRAIGHEQFAHRQTEVGRLQCSPKVGDGHTGAGHAGRIDLDDHSAAGSANRIHLAGTSDPFEIGLDAVGNPLQVKGADRGVLAEKRERNDGHVIDALGLDQRAQDTQALRQPISIGIDGVVEPHQRLGARYPHLVLHGQYGKARPRDRHYVLDAGDLRQHLLGRRGDHLFHIPCRCAGKWDQHVGHRHVDLWLLLAWRHEHGEHAQEKGADGQQRRDLRRLEIGGDTTGYAERLAHIVAFSAHGQRPADLMRRAHRR